MFDSIADRGRDLAGWPARGEDGEASYAVLAQALLAARGEATRAAIAQQLVGVCRRLDGDDRLGFFRFLAQKFSPDPEAALAAARAYRANPNPLTLRALGVAAQPPRQDLFRRMNMAPGGTALLVRLRESLLDLLPQHPELAAVDDDLLHLLASWFNRGFLTFGRVDWHSPAVLLEKLIAYEAVHPFRGWDDLRRRLGPDRRCFAFFHPALPDEPLIFVQVALTQGMADRVAPFVDPDRPFEDPAKADTAIFYSISNCQKGLRGVSFGSFLIKQVAAELQREWPSLLTFATLSPVPGFRRWLASLVKGLPAAGEQDEARKILVEVAAGLERPGWQEEPETAKALRGPLSALCAHYLTQAKRPDGSPLDPVARFHLGNGARLERIDWLGDTSPNGLRQSAGLMVNYAYRLDRLEQNHEAYVNDGRVVAARGVLSLAKQAPLPQPPKDKAA
ncbi:MAG: malonyl-CoA decarboxylase [Geminicoccaceae bacterium]|nr:malonyl-CoA decarboxylase [Geminicoccaceae bacterium]